MPTSSMSGHVLHGSRTRRLCSIQWAIRRGTDYYRVERVQLSMLTEKELASACLALIDGGGLSSMQRKIRKEIQKGGDPLGEAFSALRSAAVRRGDGAIYTPAPIVHSM